MIAVGLLTMMIMMVVVVMLMTTTTTTTMMMMMMMMRLMMMNDLFLYSATPKTMLLVRGGRVVIINVGVLSCSIVTG